MRNRESFFLRLAILLILFSFFIYISIQYSNQICLYDPLVIGYVLILAIIAWSLSGPILLLFRRKALSISTILLSALIGGIAGIVVFMAPISYPDLLHLDIKFDGADESNLVEFWSHESNVHQACFRTSGWDAVDDMLLTNAPENAALSAVIIMTEDFQIGISSPGSNINANITVDGLSKDIELQNQEPGGVNIVTIQGNYQPYRAGSMAVVLKLYRSILVAFASWLIFSVILTIPREKGITLVLILWISSVLIVYILLFPPQEFWIIMDKFGIVPYLRAIRLSIIHFFYDTISINY